MCFEQTLKPAGDESFDGCKYINSGGGTTWIVMDRASGHTHHTGHCIVCQKRSVLKVTLPK